MAFTEGHTVIVLPLTLWEALNTAAGLQKRILIREGSRLLWG